MKPDLVKHNPPAAGIQPVIHINGFAFSFFTGHFRPWLWPVPVNVTF